MSSTEGKEAMLWLVQAFYATADRKWEEVETFDDWEPASARVNVLRCKADCYLVEMWRHHGCMHAVG